MKVTILSKPYTRLNNCFRQCLITSRVASATLCLTWFCVTSVVAQSSKTNVDPAALRRSSFTWTQAEREFGFAHWDWVYAGRVVDRGAKERPLPIGRPLSRFRAGTGDAAELERFIDDEKVAGMIVLHNGKLRLERYALAHSATSRWISQSVAKSVTSTLVGAAVKDGFIDSIDDPVTKYIPALLGSGYDGVTIRQVMTMTSGVRWNEDYNDPKADIARFYSEPITPGMDATVSYMRRLPRANLPGTKWNYNTGETHLLGVIVTSATSRPLAKYLSEKIWAPYGMGQPAFWMTDRRHHELAGCCLQAGLRDFARFGQFVLDGGRIDGRSVVPDGWFEAATQTQQATSYAGTGYGYQWWTAEDGSFSAIGIHGQLIHIDPARRLVIAINSAWPVATGQDRSAARQQMLRMIAKMVDAEDRRKRPVGGVKYQ